MTERHSWERHPVVVFDTETTGVDTKTDHVVQLGGALFINGALEATFSQYVALPEGASISEGAKAVHGITEEKLVGAHDLCRAWAAMENFFGSHPMYSRRVYCAYNAPFDHSIVARVIPLHFTVKQVVDPLVWVRQHDKFVRGKGRHSLGETCKRHGVPLTGAHDAKHDATAAGYLLFKLLAKGAVPTGDFMSFIDQQARIRKHQEAEFDAWLSKQGKA